MPSVALGYHPDGIDWSHAGIEVVAVQGAGAMRRGVLPFAVLLTLTALADFTPVGGQAGSAGPFTAPVTGAASNGFNVSGSVFNAHPGVEPDRPARISLSQVYGEHTGRNAFYQATLRPDDTFVFPGVPPGSYELSANAGTHRAVRVEIGSRDVSNVRVPIVRLIPIMVQPRVDDGSAPPARIGFLVYHGGRSSLAGFIDGPQGIRPVNLAGEPARFFIVPPTGYFITSLRAGLVDLLQEPLPLAPASPPTTVSLMLSRTPPPVPVSVVLEGRVLNHPGIEIELAYSSPLRPDGGVHARTTVSAEGTYEFRDVPPGVYELNLPPARTIGQLVAVQGTRVRHDIDLPPGRLFSGFGVPVYDQSGQRGALWPGRIFFVAEGETNGVTRAFQIRPHGFWGTLPPGTYRVRIEGMAAGFGVRSMRAGSVDLLRSPYVVPGSRSPESVSLVLEQR